MGAESIISPLGLTAAANFAACLNNQTGIAEYPNGGLNGETLFASRISQMPVALKDNHSRILQMLYASVIESLAQTNLVVEGNQRVALIFSTTKGDIEALEQGDNETAHLGNLQQQLSDLINHTGLGQVVSNACISGSAALVLAHDLISTNHADHVIVTGADVVSRFTTTGFQSLHALGSSACRPFCKTRSGVSLGEGAATIIVSADKGIYKTEPYLFLGGATSNDANHISGPSRTGEGLYRAIQKTLHRANVAAGNINFISAHGTGTLYNDDMESIAFNRAGLATTPLNSMKGYFGHTLGAAGVIETAMCLQSMRNNTLLKNVGLVEPGTAQPVNVLTRHLQTPVNMVLKTASGFGGCNAALLIKNTN